MSAQKGKELVFKVMLHLPIGKWRTWAFKQLMTIYEERFREERKGAG